MSLAEDGLAREPTGIEGLDELFLGGTLPNTSMMIEGEPGSGKTTAAMQFLLAGIEQGEPGIYITMEESPAKIYRDAMGYGWDFRRFEQENKLRVIATSPESLIEQVGKAGPILETARELGAKRAVVDSITLLQPLCSEPTECRLMLSGLMHVLEREGMRVLFIRDLEQTGTEPTAAFWARYVVDTLVQLTTEKIHTRLSRRLLRIIKSRGQNHVGGFHAYKISDSGIEVFPRVMSPTTEEMPYPRKHLPTGVQGLDDMLAGGFLQGQPVLLSGPTGAGKTLFSLSYLAEGALHGSPGLLITTEGTQAELIAHGESVGVEMGRLVSDGLLNIERIVAPEVALDEIVFQIRKRLESRQYERIVIDSLSTIESISPDPSFTRDAMEYVVRLLIRHGVTPVMTYETTAITGNITVTETRVSSLVDTIVLLRLIEIEGDVKKGISVLKHRGSRHATDVRQITIDDSGIKVLSGFEGYQGVLTGVPAVTRPYAG